MRLFIIRHGDALGGGPDDGRPLSAHGMDQVRNVAMQALNRGDCRPVHIWHSPKKRAVETAAILAEILRPPQGMTAVEGLLPDDDPAGWVLPLKRLDDDLLWVSHMPLVSALTQTLLHPGSRRIGGFTTAEMHGLERLEKGQWGWLWRLLPVP